DRVFLTAAVGGSPARLGGIALGRKTGKQLWVVEGCTAEGKTHPQKGHAPGTITNQGPMLFGFFGSRRLFALDFTGPEVWRQSLGKLEHGWGTASSPTLYKDLVIQLCDSGQYSSLRAFRQQTGEPVWTAPRDSYGCWTTPIVIQAPLAAADAAANGKLA